MLTCGICGARLLRGTHRDVFAGAVSVRGHMEKLRYIAGALRRHPVLTERGQDTADRLSSVADLGEALFERLHGMAHGLWRGAADTDWSEVQDWIADANEQLEPWMRRALAAGY